MQQTVHLQQKALATAMAFAFASINCTDSVAQSQDSPEDKEKAASPAVPVVTVTAQGPPREHPQDSLQYFVAQRRPALRTPDRGPVRDAARGCRRIGRGPWCAQFRRAQWHNDTRPECQWIGLGRFSNVGGYSTSPSPIRWRRALPSARSTMPKTLTIVTCICLMPRVNQSQDGWRTLAMR